VFDLLDAEPRPESLHLVGRLDLDTTGLVLLTDDGDWSHRITAPRKKRPKVYRVRLAHAWSREEPALTILREGVSLRGDDRPTAPAEVDWLGGDDLRLVIREGRYHQVKRMLAAVGNRVVSLHRERIGALALDPSLSPGAYRSLTEIERELALSDTSPC
jgi:16S rRNA pseudouridine516 synthase